ncbi:conserved hypothetical protein [Desulfamplus magnetovallimortis]|uniref:Rubrerythrin diiron-binding domain-containing protein n=1 Tax=Desulfamplus magnetovallimortis TaxID=1246637 RepID=A0A1W1H845_9BACT|nr:ferritin family protein [Desulfamplus magnetovallimortis]SLM28641.1 conserved hypothetical protein [Desulfamplus magnetovallimortis]
MSYNFSADEIFEMAKQIEVNGAKFYKEAAEKVQGESEKEFLTTLAHMEEKHEKTFAKMHEQFKAIVKDKDESMFDPDGEAVRYLKSLADSKIFFKKDPPGDTMENILHSAIRAEQDSVIFYLGMCELVSDELGKNRVDKIIKEELDHIRILSQKATEIGI